MADIRVQFINNDGAGFADDVVVEEGTTASQLFAQQMGQVDPGSYLIRVNRQACSADKELQSGDKMTVTPTKIEGA